MTTSETSTYEVVLLIEETLSDADAVKVVALHEGLDDPVSYRVLLPVEDRAAQIESGLTGLAAGEMAVVPVLALDTDLEQIQQELLQSAQEDLSASLQALTRAGGTATGTVVSVDPVEALATHVAEVGAAEAIVLTRPHVVRELFHVDWTSRARRRLGVPVLHLLEHEDAVRRDSGGSEA